MFERILLSGTSIPRIEPHTCGRHACPPGWHVNRAYLKRNLIHYVLKGSGTFVKNGVTHSIHAGDLFICRYGENASYTASKEDPWDYVMCGFNCSSEFDPLLLEDVISLPAAAPIFTQLSSCRSSTTKEWIIVGLLYQLFAMLASIQNYLSQSKDYVRQAISYIESHYFNQIQVTQIAEFLGLSRSYLCRIFRRQTGMSPQEYLVSYRLEKAAGFLTTYKLSQKEVARQVGYPDVYSFSRMFKRKYGISPGQYQKNYGHSILDVEE